MALTPEIPDIKDVIKDELATTGDWVVANVDARMSWPVSAQKVQYRGVELWVLPVMKEHYPGVALKRTNAMPKDEAERVIMRFLSALSWVENGGIIVERFTNGNMPRPSFRDQKRYGFGIQAEFELSYLPEPVGEKAQLALALMREGQGLNHPAYAFLSFYRVLEVAFPDGKKRGKWMTKCVDRLHDQRAIEVVAKLRADNIVDVGEHLQKSGRQAIAHAASNPIINPDDPADARRLSAELPIMNGLAVLAIEEELGVETRQTVWRKHLYELEGFKKLISEDVIDAVVTGAIVAGSRNLELPAINVELRKRKPYTLLRNLQPVGLEQNGPMVTFIAQSLDKCFSFRCHLDFPNERLHFDLFADLQATDDGTAEGGEQLAEIERFIRDYLGNGELRIVDSETGELLSRKDAFIPMNCFVDTEACNARIMHWKNLASERREKSAT